MLKNFPSLRFEINDLSEKELQKLIAILLKKGYRKNQSAHYWDRKEFKKYFAINAPYLLANTDGVVHLSWNSGIDLFSTKNAKEFIKENSNLL